ncbi:hypothetical protein UlMin_018436 [Ulmus minor]
MVFGFLDEDYGEGMSLSPESGSDDGVRENDLNFNEEIEDDEKDCTNGGIDEDKRFWENQHQLLQATLYRTSSLETRIRNTTKEGLKEIQISNTVCGCGREMATGCRKCLMREISGRIRNEGFNSAICKSKWRSSPDIPSGEHTFLDVVENSSRKKGQVRVIIELNFKAEFEMARASEDYNKLVQRLPEVFVGKVERLHSLIKVMCSAAKKCMKEKKMHLGPWRKYKYMQAKWLAACQRTASPPLLSLGYSAQTAKPRSPAPPKASMLTVDLLDMLPNMAVAVV